LQRNFSFELAPEFQTGYLNRYLYRERFRSGNRTARDSFRHSLLDFSLAV